MKICQYCDKKIGIFQTVWESADKNIAMHDKCYKKYTNDPEIKKQISEEEERTKSYNTITKERKSMVNTHNLAYRPKRYTSMGITLRIFGVLSTIICLVAGINMTTLRSVSGNSVAEAYYQSVGVFVIGLSFFIGIFLWGFGCLIDNKLLRK